MWRSAEEGNVKPVKLAMAINFKSENELQECGIFGWSTARQIIGILIYFFSLHFTLRACKEHKELEFEENS